MAQTLEQAMAKKGRPKSETGEGKQVRLPPDLVRKASFIVTDSDKSVSEYFASILRPVVERDFKKKGRELLEE